MESGKERNSGQKPPWDKESKKGAGRSRPLRGLGPNRGNLLGRFGYVVDFAAFVSTRDIGSEMRKTDGVALFVVLKGNEIFQFLRLEKLPLSVALAGLDL